MDDIWEKLSAHKEAEQYGWLKDKYRLFWQIVPTALNEMMTDKNPKKTENVMKAMLQIKKIDVEKLKQAYLSA